MQDQIEVRIDVTAKSVSEVYFWQNDQHSESLYLYGAEDEYIIEGNPIPESIFAWVTLLIQRREGEKNRSAWEVVYKTNVVDNSLQAALEGIKRKIEAAIAEGKQRRIILNDNLKLSEWETALPKQNHFFQGSEDV